MVKQPEWYFQKDDICLSGVVKIAEKVKNDIYLVTGRMPSDYSGQTDSHGLVIYGTVGNSKLLDEYEGKGLISLDEIKEKREVYGFFVLDNPAPNVSQAIVIAGSDKRGTIYPSFMRNTNKVEFIVRRIK